MVAAGTKSQVKVPPGDLRQTPHSPLLRVCLVVDSLRPDAGTEKLVERLASAFDPAVIEAHVCCFETSERLKRLPTQVQPTVFPLRSINTLAGVRQMYAFRAYLRRNRIEAVHSFMNKSAIFSVLAAQGTGCRTVITSRLNFGYWYTRRLAWMFRILNHFSTHVLTNSALAKELTVSVEGISPDKITVLYPGVDLRRFASGNPQTAAALGIPRDALLVGIVANFRPVKNLPLFLRAAAVVSAAVPSAAFLLVGQGSLKPKLQQLAAELGIADRVFFSSPEGAVPDYLARMSVACLSSESEGLPNAIMEYMAAGLPVVATDVGGIPELVRDGASGFLVRTSKAEDFAAPIIQLLRNEDLRSTMGRRGLERAKAEFDMSASVARLQQFYIDAVAGVPGREMVTRPPSTVPMEQK